MAVYIEEISTGKKIVDYNGQKALIPASVLKAITCATAMERLGGDYRFVTTFDLIGTDPEKGIGDIVVGAVADPTTGSREFNSSMHLPDSVTAALAAHGINYIDGNIVFDNSILPEGGGPVPQWEVEDVSESYGVGLYPFNWLDNYFEEHFIIPSPPEYFAEILSENLTSNEIEIGGNISEATDSVPVRVINLFTNYSPPLREIMRTTMVKSLNLMAEGILRAITPKESRDSALSAVKRTWQKLDIDLSQSRLLDGSGLSRGNTISASSIASVLSYMAKSKYSRDYVSLFPVAGKEGTVKNFLSGTRLSGKLALKSGTMTGVHCYAGYLLKGSARQPTHTIVIMVNNFYCSRAQLRKAIETYLLQVL